MGHKSPENNALVEAEDLDAIFDDDVSMDSFLKAFQKDPSLAICDTGDAFKFNNWWSAPVETCTKYCTVLEIILQIVPYVIVPQIVLAWEVYCTRI